MLKKVSKKALPLILAMLMLVGAMPMSAFADDSVTGIIAVDEEKVFIDLLADDVEVPDVDVLPTIEGTVDNYADFMKYLRILEGYAESYAESINSTGMNKKDPAELVLNFIRTGVERY
ncbi:MAG: hypothetical protein IKI93_05845, partial [Clostridia bacterium]|nr:hypothetical protein [Clostridia bacterium]